MKLKVASPSNRFPGSCRGHSGCQAPVPALIQMLPPEAPRPEGLLVLQFTCWHRQLSQLGSQLWHLADSCTLLGCTCVQRQADLRATSQANSWLRQIAHLGLAARCSDTRGLVLAACPGCWLRVKPGHLQQEVNMCSAAVVTCQAKPAGLCFWAPWQSCASRACDRDALCAAQGMTRHSPRQVGVQQPCAPASQLHCGSCGTSV